MEPYTLDSCLTFGYRGGLYNHNDKKLGDQLECQYARCTREPADFKEECKTTARLIAVQAKNIGRKPVLMLSGGLDSEVMTMAFMEAGVDFSVVTYEFEAGLNSHEINYVNKFKGRHDLNHTFYKFDIKAWLKSDEAHTMFKNTMVTSAGSLPHMKLIQHIWQEGGVPVVGNGDLYLENTSNGWQYTEMEYMLAWHRFAIDNKILCSTAFFQHTPEIVLAAVRHPVFQRLGTGLNSSANIIFKNSRYVKCEMYREIWPELEKRQKFHGAELIIKTVLSVDAQHHLPVSFNDKVQIPFGEFESMLQMITNPVPHS